MEESSSTIKIEKLNRASYYDWTQKIKLPLSLCDLDQYINNDPPAADKDFKVWKRGDRKARAMIGFSLSDEHLNHVRDAQAAKAMWTPIKDIFEHHTLLNKLDARRRSCTATMEVGEKLLTCKNRVQQFAATLKSMSIDIDQKEIAMAVLNGLPPQYEYLIVALDALVIKTNCSHSSL